MSGFAGRRARVINMVLTRGGDGSAVALRNTVIMPPPAKLLHAGGGNPKAGYKCRALRAAGRFGVETAEDRA